MMGVYVDRPGQRPASQRLALSLTGCGARERPECLFVDPVFP